MDEFAGPIYAKDFETGMFWKADSFSSNELQPVLSLNLQDGSEKNFNAAWRMGSTDRFAFLSPQENGIDWEASGYEQVEDPELIDILEML